MVWSIIRHTRSWEWAGSNVGHGAAACRNEFVAARLLGADIRHSSLYAVAGVFGFVRHTQTKRWSSCGQRLGQRDYTDVQRRLRARTHDRVTTPTDLADVRNHCRG